MKKKSLVRRVNTAKKVLKNNGQVKYILCLYVAGMTPTSTAAVRNVKTICEESLHGRYDLKIVDIQQQPILARDAQILAAPTLIKKLPLPIRRFIGDMSNKERILLGLDLQPIN